MADAVMVRKSFLKKLIDRGRRAPSVIVREAQQAPQRAVQIVKRLPGRARDELLSDGSGIRSAGIGALAAYAVSTDFVKKSDFFKKNWWALPLALIGFGYFMLRKGKPIGRTLMTIGGLLFVQAYQNRPKTDEKDDKAKKDDAKETKGFEPMQFAPPYGSRWVVTADGRQVLVPARQLEHYERPGLPERRDMADAVARTADEIYGRTF